MNLHVGRDAQQEWGLGSFTVANDTASLTIQVPPHVAKLLKDVIAIIKVSVELIACGEV
jgi:hypothetical protein